MARILCFVGELTVDFQASLMRAFSAKAVEHGHELVYCINFDINSLNAMHGECEKKIIHLPDFSAYDGIIVCLDTFGIDGMAEELADYVDKNAKCPVISIRVQDERFYNILLDDSPAIENMVEHFITDHGLSRICFMTGRMDLVDAHRRFDAYRKVMARHNIPVTDGMVFYGDYWREKGEEAVEWFISQNEELPQAIVCSNDYMAISVCNALTARNLRVPQDICVSGFDNIEEACYHMPPITSISAPTDLIAKSAFDFFEDLANGKKRDREMWLPLQMYYRNSCGCSHDIDFQSFRKLYEAKEVYLSALHFCPYVNLDFDAVDTMSELFYSVHTMLSSNIYGCPVQFGTMYFCFCDESERQENLVEMASNFTDHMVLAAVINRDGVQQPGIRFERKDLLPKEYYDPKKQSYVFVLHCKEFSYGYIVLQDETISAVEHIIKTLVFSIGNALDRIRIYSENQTIQSLKQQAYIDALTGIPNRRYMEHFIRKLYERLQRTNQRFCIMSIDMDGLKYINDNFGHLDGDWSIITLAKLLDSLKMENALAARIGGDEFTMLFPSDDEQDALDFIDKLEKEIEQCNRESGKPYEISISVGYEYCMRNMDLLLCMHNADKKMYEAKNLKKQKQGNSHIR